MAYAIYNSNMPVRESISGTLGILKDALAVLKEAAIIVCIGALVLFPSQIMGAVLTIAKQANVSNVEFGPFKWVIAAQKTDQAAQQIDAVTDGLNSVIADVSDPAIKARLQEVLDHARGTQAQVDLVNATIKEGLASQQEAAPTQVSQTETSSQRGWIYLGKISDDGKGNQQWLPGQPQTINPIAIDDIVPGKVVTIRDDVYLRDPVSKDKAATAQILRVLLSGTQAVIDGQLNKDSLSADKRTRYAWVLVKPKS